MTASSESACRQEQRSGDDSNNLDESTTDMDFLRSRRMGYANKNRKFDPKNPSLFSETYAMSLAAAAIFSFADVRRAAHMGQIDAPEAIGLPLRVSKALQVYSQHKDALQKILKEADASFLNSMLQQIEDEAQFEGFFISNIVNHAMIHYFGDDDNNSECVYFLLENPELSRIVLCFRGTITMKDWIKDSKVTVCNIKNPLFMRPDQPEEIGVHLGFREYLYDENTAVSLKLPPVKEKIDAVKKAARELPSQVAAQIRNDNEEPRSVKRNLEKNASLASVDESKTETPDGTTAKKKEETPRGPQPETANPSGSTNTSRLTQILDQVNNLRTKNKDYRIYVTGHSLGGALALLTALEVAAHWGRAENPVTFIGIGNPRAATYSFRKVVETLEQEGKMRCLGIHNHLDIVPMIPTSALHIRKKNTFCQVGFQILLHPTKFEMSYCPQTNNTWQDFKDQAERMALAIFRPDKIADRHHYLTYLAYLQNLEVALNRLHLNDYYNNTVAFNLFHGSESIYALSPSRVSTKRQRDSLFGGRSVCITGSGEDEEKD